MVFRLVKFLLPAVFLLGTGPVLSVQSFAEEIAVRYELIDRRVDWSGETWNLQLEVFNKSPRDLRNISIDLLSDVTTFATVEPFWVDELLSPERINLAGIITIPEEFLPETLPLKFYVVYESGLGTPISAIVEGQSTNMDGEGIP